MNTSITYRNSIKTHIADAVNAVDFSQVAHDDADALRTAIEETGVTLALSCDCNIDMMQFIADVEDQFDIQKPDFTKCDNYKEAMYVEFTAYMNEVVEEVLSEFVKQIIETAERLEEAACAEFSDVENIVMGTSCPLDAIPHDTEATHSCADGKSVDYCMWIAEETLCTNVGGVYIMASA